MATLYRFWEMSIKQQHLAILCAYELFLTRCDSIPLKCLLREIIAIMKNIGCLSN